MDILKEIINELKMLGFNNIDKLKIQEIRNKDGVYVYRIGSVKTSYILKYFLKREYAREIENYRILQGLGVQPIKVFGSTGKSILMEDINESGRYRLGTEEDLSDVKLAKKLAQWYKSLHEKGHQYLLKNNSGFYRETDDITRENIDIVRIKSYTEMNRVWNLILDNLGIVHQKIRGLEETLTYNDFYWTNLVVSMDMTEAFMYDYNLLGAGFRYSDIRNVCFSLSDEAQGSFINEYGSVDVNEKIMDDGIGILFTLIAAYKREVFPKWGEGSLKAVHDGTLEKNICRILLIP